MRGLDSFEQMEIFISGEYGYNTYRIPAIVVSNKDSLLAFCEGRKNTRSDTGYIDIVLKRSFDNGKTWEQMQVIAEDRPNTMGNPCPVVDRDTGTIWLPFTRNLGEDGEGKIWDGTSEGTRTVWVMNSTDDGATWSEPVEITQTVKEADWTWYATGPGVGIQLKSGRLLIPCDHGVAVSRDYYSHVIYSDDHGNTWNLGGSTLSDSRTSECQVVELHDGAVLLDIRNHPCYSKLRATSISRDAGITWSNVTLDLSRIDPGCQASIIGLAEKASDSQNTLIFSNPASTTREKMTIYLSYDEGNTWPVSKLLYAGPSAYSCLTVLPDMKIGCLYECGKDVPYEAIALATFSLEWLTE